MIGGAYLCFEGAEKVLHSLQKHKTSLAEEAAIVADKDHEEAMVKGAVRTDFILSAEIMVIALNEVLDEHFAMRAATLRSEERREGKECVITVRSRGSPTP